ncbi:MAG: tRNA dihydrouridine synthase DusB [Mollicutes bacterium]|nr:tRNA dihydrouridine synthase DusB [Mollicutes bacterium]
MGFNIGPIKIKNKVCLAPMAGICDSAFRRIVKEMGCGLVFAEMVSDKAIVYDNEKTKNMLRFTEQERPIAQQIFGSDKESFVKAAQIIEKNMKPDIIDINMGCPVPKVAVRAQAGSALLKDVGKIYEIVKAVVESVSCPVTVKIRSGWDQTSINAIVVAQTIEKAGASAITIHPRTRSQGYSGLSNWEIIKQVKEKVKIPVIGNGDIKTKEDAERMFQETNCDAIMIGRGLLGNPWLVKEIIENKNQDISIGDRIKLILKHIKYLLEEKPEKTVVLEMRKHIAWYFKGVPNSSDFKKTINQVTSVSELVTILNNFQENETLL